MVIILIILGFTSKSDRQNFFPVTGPLQRPPATLTAPKVEVPELPLRQISNLVSSFLRWQKFDKSITSLYIYALKQRQTDGESMSLVSSNSASE